MGGVVGRGLFRDLHRLRFSGCLRPEDVTIESCGHAGDIDDTGLCKFCHWQEAGPWTDEQIEEMNELLGEDPDEDDDDES